MPRPRFNRTPMAIGIAGNSSVGKDSLAEAFRFFVGRHRVSIISGDNYHLWERLSPVWLTKTHLDPSANNLQLWSEHLRMAVRRKSYNGPCYDHRSGQFYQVRQKHKSDFVLSQGLHALYGNLGDSLNLRIFMSMDEESRSSLKILRDTTYRNRKNQDSSMVERRNLDYQRFVLPQHEVSDIHFHQFRLSARSDGFLLAFHIADKEIRSQFTRFIKQIVSIEVYTDTLFDKPFTVVNCEGLTADTLRYLFIYDKTSVLCSKVPDLECIHSSSLGLMTLLTYKFLARNVEG